MTKFFALNISVSEDGFMAGPNQSLDTAFGEGGEQLLKWAWATKSVREWWGPNPEVQLKNYRALEPVASETVVHQTYLKI